MKTKKQRQAMREREVLKEIRRNNGNISTFWLCDPMTRWAALNRMEKRGTVITETVGYPHYLVREVKK